MARCAVGIARADHQIQLPLVPNTPAIENIWADGSTTWCLNARASSYPSFRAQVEQAFGDMQAQTGNTFTELFSTAEDSNSAASMGCEYLLRMPTNDQFCQGCAAHIYYYNDPVVAEFRWTLGYSIWTDAIGHETGHLLGLHEQYIDSGGAIQCGNPKTVSLMDCGYPHLWQLQPFDMGNLKNWLYAPGISYGGVATHEGEPFVWYCGGDPETDRADQAAVFYYDSWSDAYYWSGLVYPIARGNTCQNFNTWVYCAGANGREIWVNEQISGWPWSSWTPGVRNDTYAGTCH